MKQLIIISFFALLLFPTGLSFSQVTDKEPTLGITLTSFTPFFYKSEDGSTVIIGQVENKKNFPVSGVKILASFYDDTESTPLESKIGTTVLEVIPPNGKSPYMIKSNVNPKISNVSVNILGFNSSPPKQEGLVIDVTSIDDSDRLRIAGTIHNNLGAPTENTTVYLALYDAFEPPRIVSLSSYKITDNTTLNTKTEFSFDEKRPQSITGFIIFADSSNLTSKLSDRKLNQPQIISLLVTINDVKISDKSGKSIPSASVGNPIVIKSFLRLESQSSISLVNQQYVYYAQVKNSGQPTVEFIGTAEGIFESDSDQLPSTEWTPEKSGLYFVETFVWDPNGVPLSSKGPIILVLVK